MLFNIIEERLILSMANLYPSIYILLAELYLENFVQISSFFGLNPLQALYNNYENLFLFIRKHSLVTIP